jgi:hypothetical protein
MRMRFRWAAIVCLALAWPAAAEADTVTVKFTSVVRLQTTLRDTKPVGEGNKGDRIGFRDLLLNVKPLLGKQKGKPVAWDVGTIVYVTSAKQTITCTVHFTGMGTLFYEGPLTTRSDGNVVLPISNGTGAFKGVQGTVTIGPGERESANTFTLTVPGKLDFSGAPGPVA